MIFKEKRSYTPLLNNEKIRIAFLFQSPPYWPSWESFYRACLADNRFDARLVLLDMSGPYLDRAAEAERFLTEENLIFTRFSEFDIEKHKPHVVVMQTPYDDWHRLPPAYSTRIRRLGARIAYIPYGIEFADTANARLSHFHTFTVLNAWRIYVLSDLMEKEYRKNCPNRKAARVCGHPKFDGYTDKQRFRLPESLERRIGSRKVVVWKIHFPKTNYNNGQWVTVTPDIDEYIRFAEKIPRFNDLFFIFMPHPNIINGDYPRQFHAQIETLMKKLGETENIYIDEADDYRPSILRAQAMIADRSALMIEAAVTGIPILYLYNPDYTEKLTEAVAPLMDSFYKGTAADDMARFVEQFISGNDPQKETREKAFRLCVPYTDGKCGERITNDIADSIISEMPDEICRIAVFGMADVFRYYWNLIDALRGSRFEISVIADNNEKMWDTDYNGIPVVSPMTLREYEFDFLVVFTEQHYRDIFRQLVYEVNIDMDKIMRLDRFLLATYVNPDADGYPPLF